MVSPFQSVSLVTSAQNELPDDHQAVDEDQRDCKGGTKARLRFSPILLKWCKVMGATGPGPGSGAEQRAEEERAPYRVSLLLLSCHRPDSGGTSVSGFKEVGRNLCFA